MTTQPSPAQIIQSALFPGSDSGRTYEKTGKVLEALREHGWIFIHNSVVDDTPATFQVRVLKHLDAVTVGDPTDLAERIARFFEEGAELVQSLGLAYGDAQAVVDYVYSRPAGEPRQELGGTMTTLANLATLAGLDMMACGEAELARTWQPEVFAKIQRKRAARHGRGPLPGVDGGVVTKVIVSGGRRPAEPSDPDAPIWRRQVLISWPEAAATKDTVDLFAHDCLVAEPGGFLSASGAHIAYQIWCRTTGMSPLPLYQFYGRLLRFTSSGLSVGGIRGFANVRLKDETPIAPTDDITPEAVATLRASADAAMKGETWEEVATPYMETAEALIASVRRRPVLNDLAATCHKLNEKWWRDPVTGWAIQRNKGELLMLIVSEIAEAMEGERKDLMDDKLPHRRMAEVELADALIRIFDYAGAFGYDLDGAVTEKLAFNATRADHTHEARLRAGGKKW